MRTLPLIRIVSAVALATGLGLAQAHAQAATPQQIQAQIANGQASTALGELNTALQAHPNSGVAWYLTAEAQDATGNEAAARAALGKAEQISPGLPFAQPSDVAALRAHLAAAPAAAGAPAPASGGMGLSPMVLGIGALVVLFILIRMFMRRRTMAPQMYPNSGMNPGYQGGPPAPYGQGGVAPFGGGMGMGGGGMGSSLLGGLAAGAGLAAGERAIDGLMGGGRGGGLGEPTQGEMPPAEPPARDDGLTGSPGWGDNSGGGGGGGDNGGNFDPNNSW